MTNQLVPTFAYVVIVLIALLTPYITCGQSRIAADRPIMGAILGCALVLTAVRHGAFEAVSLILLLPLLGSGVRALLGGIAAVLLFAPVIWWMPNMRFGPSNAALFALLALFAGQLPRLGRAAVSEQAAPRMLAPMLIASLVGIVIGLFTAPFGSVRRIAMAWHHWSAYLSPVDAWLAGGAPYRDFPVQYGIGPTSVLAATCGSNCWSALYAVAVVADALYFAVLTGCVLILTRRRTRGLRWLALVALWCATFVWTAFPADLGSTVMTPSVAGLRFLPIAALLLHILRAECSDRRRDWIGHAIWLCDMFWSPESAFFGTLTWWPYLALRNAADTANFRERWIALMRGAVRGVAAVMASGVALAAALWWLSAGSIRPRDYFAYILYPPAPMPVNAAGPIWLVLAVLLLAIVGLLCAGRCSRGRSLYACLLGFLAAGTYYLSRSHDNNILNLFPLLVVLLTAVIQSDRTQAFTDGFVRTVLAAMIAFVSASGLTSWIEGARTEGLFNIGPSRLIARFAAQPGSQPQFLSTHTLEALAYLRGRRAGPVVLLDESSVIPWHPAGEGWTGVNNVANFYPLPRTLVIRSICRGAIAYRRSGWILVDEPKYGDWATMFQAGYEVRERVDFGDYRAYHLFPRRGPLACADL